MFTYEIIYRNVRTGALHTMYRTIYLSVVLGTKSQPLRKVEPNQPLRKVEPNQPLRKVEPNPFHKSR